MGVFMKRSLMALLLLIFSSPYVVAGNSTWDTNAWSTWLHKKVEPISRIRYRLTLFNNADATEADKEYQALGKEAQNKVGVPSREQLPVKNIPLYAKLPRNAYALASTDAIYIDPTQFSDLSYGEKRSIFFHEAVHVKYHDETKLERSLVDGLAQMAVLSVASGLAIKLLPFFPSIKNGLVKLSDMRIPVLSLGVSESLSTASEMSTPVLSVVSAFFLSSIYRSLRTSFHHEKRADIEGAYASSCYRCVGEQAEHAPWRWGNEWDSMSMLANGYASRQDMYQIRDQLKLENKVCDYHSKIKGDFEMGCEKHSNYKCQRCDSSTEQAALVSE